MFNLYQCQYRTYYYHDIFDFGYRCSKITDIILVCPADFSFGQCVPLCCPRIEITTDNQTSAINKDDDNV